MIRIEKEEQVVNDQTLRKAIIAEINLSENQARKDEAYRRNLCLKDKTKLYTILELLKQFDNTTVSEMSYSLTNVSVARKIIDKLARVYSAGVTRSAGEGKTKETEAVEHMAKLLDMNKEMKRTNKYLRAHKNVIAGVIPCKFDDNGKPIYSLKMQVLQPYLYDAIEHEYDREKAMFYIISDYQRVMPAQASMNPSTDGRGATGLAPRKIGDSKDQMIADTPGDNDGDKREFIWWSSKFHFKTNVKGEILPNEIGEIDTANPIMKMPYENFAMDQDGQFWAEGGDDVFDAGVQINCMLSNLQHIGVTQGYGQFWMKGKGLPKLVKQGPNKVILMEQENKDDPEPQLGFASANPKLSELKDLIIMHVALTLTTNNLSTRSVSTELGGSQDFPSGVALIIDKADSIEDVGDQQEIFRKLEPELFDTAQRWQEVYGSKNLLMEEYKEMLLPRDPTVELKFLEQRAIMSEKEKLENIKLRKELGINTMLELIMQDDPSLTVKQAEARLTKILEEAIKAKAQGLMDGDDEQVDENGKPIEGKPGEKKPKGDDEGNLDGGKQQEDGLKD